MSLHDAVRNGNVAEVRTLIATGSNVNQVDKLKRTPLHMAAWTGNKEILQVLVRANANVLDKATDAFTPLHFAAQSQSSEAAECVRVLLKANKSLMHQRISKGNKSALHLAAIKGNESVMLTLVELGADVNATTSSGQTYLDLVKDEEVKAQVIKKVAELHEQKPEKASASKPETTETEVSQGVVGTKRRIDEVAGEEDTEN